MDRSIDLAVQHMSCNPVEIDFENPAESTFKNPVETVFHPLKPLKSYSGPALDAFLGAADDELWFR